LKAAIKLLGDFPDPGDEVITYINVAMEDGFQTNYGDAIDALIEQHGEDYVREVLKQHGQAQLLDNIKNSHDYEHIEASMEEYNDDDDYD